MMKHDQPIPNPRINALPNPQGPLPIAEANPDVPQIVMQPVNSCSRTWLLFLALWLLIIAGHLATLDWVPLAFIDEPFHGQMSRSIVEQGVAINHSFPLRYKERPWPISLLMAVQAPVIRVLGYNLFALRLPSLAFFAISLLFWFAAIKRFAGQRAAFWFVLLYSLQLPVFHSTHFARPESGTLFILSVSVWLLTLFDSRPFLKMLCVAAVSPLAYRSQPVGLIVPFIMAFVGLYWLWRRGQLNRRVVGLGIVAAIVLLFAFNHFFRFKGLLQAMQSSSAGFAGVSLNIPITERLTAFPRIFIEDILQPAHHYLRLLHVIGLLGLVVFAVSRRDRSPESNFGLGLAGVGLAAAWCGLSLAGRPSRFYMVHLYPWLALLLVCAVARAMGRRRLQTVTLAGIACYYFFNVLLFINLFRGIDTAGFGSRLRDAVPPGHTVLGPIRNELFLGEGRRYLAFLDMRGVDGPVMSLEEYVQRNRIEYVVFDTYMDDNVHRPNHPGWLWLQQVPILEFLDEHAELIVVIQDNYYGSSGKYCMAPWARGPLAYYRLSSRKPFVWRRFPRRMFETRIYRIK